MKSDLMNQTQLKEEDFSYTANSRGYMLKYKGQYIGGAGILSGIFGPNGKQGEKQTQDYIKYAQIDILDILCDNPGHYKERIDKINNR